MNPVLDNIKSRRSIRSFTDEPVAADAVKQIVEAALWAPSAMNRQTWQFTVIQDRKVMARLAELVAKKIGKEPGAYNFYKPSVLVVTSNAVSNKRGFADCSCAMQNIMLMSHALGLGSVWINQVVDINEDPDVIAAFAEIGVPADHRVYALASIGHIAGQYPEGAERVGKVVYV